MDEPLSSWFDERLPAELVESALFRFKVVLVDGREIIIDVTKDVDINYEQLEEQLRETPSQYAYWGMVYSEVRRMVAFLENRIKARRGRLAKQLLEQAQAAGLRLTDKQVSLVIDDDPALKQLEEGLEITQRDCGKLWYMVKAVEMKSEHLRSLAGFKRQERQEHR